MNAVIFDMYETLVTLMRTPVYWSEQIAEDCGIPLSQFKPLWDQTEDERTLGILTTGTAMERIFSQLGMKDDGIIAEVARKRKASKVVCFDSAHMHPDIIPLFKELKSRGIRIGLVSNCFHEEAEVIRESILFPWFDAAMLSCEIGLKKPDPLIFTRCMNLLAAEDRTVHGNAADAAKPFCRGHDLRMDARRRGLPGPEAALLAAEDRTVHGNATDTAKHALYVGDGGSNELPTAASCGLIPLQACWYLIPESKQPCGRLPEFPHLSSPLDILNWL